MKMPKEKFASEADDGHLYHKESGIFYDLYNMDHFYLLLMNK